MEKHPKRGSFNAVFAWCGRGYFAGGCGPGGSCRESPLGQAGTAGCQRPAGAQCHRPDSADVEFWPWEALAQARAADSP